MIGGLTSSGIFLIAAEILKLATNESDGTYTVIFKLLRKRCYLFSSSENLDLVPDKIDILNINQISGKNK